MIEFKDVSKVYGNGTRGLDHIDLTIADGEFVSIIGLSGAGKSTLLRSINRLIDVSEGEVVVDGVSVTRADKRRLREVRRRIGMISQHFNLVKRSTVQRNVLSGRLGYYSTLKSILGLFTQEDYRNAERALETVGLSDKLHSRSDELSGGQQQRVSIARALVQRADIILADEPVASLDPVTTQTVMNDLARINREEGKTVVVNIHSVDLARQFSTRVIALRAGRLVFDGTPAELTEERLAAIYDKGVAAAEKGAEEGEGGDVAAVAPAEKDAETGAAAPVAADVAAPAAGSAATAPGVPTVAGAALREGGEA